MDGRDRLSVVTLEGDILFTLEVRPYVIPDGIEIAYLRYIWSEVVEVEDEGKLLESCFKFCTRRNGLPRIHEFK
jgi:hypothetical protein